jgi:hypothetical protein
MALIMTMIMMSQDSFISVVTGYDKRPGFDSQQGHVFYFCATTARPALRSTQTPNQWVPMVLCPRYSGRSVKLTTASSAEVKNSWKKYVPASICPKYVVIKNKEFTFFHIKKVSIIQSLFVGRNPVVIRQGIIYFVFCSYPLLLLPFSL